uniref:Uncharacterized protein n=1 Tax=Siphoviridae sp. ctg4a4 TaxID=2825602 RepID=A0A8S5V618_9CAUD|nr:MAG TPA: hypothetical protein [Siphoviridae sp. ctg4a4]
MLFEGKNTKVSNLCPKFAPKFKYLRHCCYNHNLVISPF